MLTVYELAMLLHYASSGRDHPDMTRCPDAWSTGIKRLCGLLLMTVSDNPECGSIYTLTDRGRTHVAAMQLIGLSEQAWLVVSTRDSSRDVKRITP